MSEQSISQENLYCKKPDGVYFGLDEDEYHSLPRLSASGIKKLLVSPMNFWADSFLNPNREREETGPMIVGKAYHKRILEGRDAFYAAYAVSYEGVDQELDTVKDMQDFLELEGIKLKASAKKDDYIREIKEKFPTAKFAGDGRAAYNSKHEGKIFLSKTLIEQIEIAALMIEKHDQLSKCVQGGYPEVTILWTCKETNVQMKARLDYLKTKAITDLKTFANKSNKSIDRALYGIMAAEKYHVQSAVYYEAVEYARELPLMGTAPGSVLSWIGDFRAAEEKTFVFIFQQKGTAPVTRGKIMPKNQVNELGRIMMREGQKAYSINLAHYGRDPWIDTQPITEFNDQEFPVWINEL